MRLVALLGNGFHPLCLPYPGNVVVDDWFIDMNGLPRTISDIFSRICWIINKWCEIPKFMREKRFVCWLCVDLPKTNYERYSQVPNSRGGHFRFFHHFFPVISIYNAPPNCEFGPKGDFFCKIRPFLVKKCPNFAYFSPFWLFFRPPILLWLPNLWTSDKKPTPILLYPPTIRYLRVLGTWEYTDYHEFCSPEKESFFLDMLV